MDKGKKRTSPGVLLMEGWMYLHGLLPLSYHRWWGKVLGKALFKVFRYRRDVVMTNIGRSFPEKDYAELKSIAKKFYIHFATVYTTMIWFSACRGEKGRRRLQKAHLVKITTPEVIRRLLENRTQLMVLSSHTGHFEALGGFALFDESGTAGFDSTQFGVTYKKLKSRFWDQVIEYIRLAPIADIPGVEGYLESEQVLRFALSHKDRRYVYCFNTDQYPYQGKAVAIPVQFMNQQTMAMKGAATLARKLDMNVAYMRHRCNEDGSFEISIIHVAEPASSLSPEEIMQKYYQLLEEDLRQQPWNYLWTHKRWKKI